MLTYDPKRFEPDPDMSEVVTTMAEQASASARLLGDTISRIVPKEN